jgi:hypothetical protein
MLKLRWITICLALMLFQGSRFDPSQPPAAPTTPAEKNAPPTPIAEEKAALGDDQTWQPEWDKIVEDALPADLLSSKVARDVKPFCPRFNALSEVDKRAYWAYFFQALSGAEAGLRPTADVRHTEPEVAVVDGVSHHMVRSEGLLQLAYEDADRYGCDFDWSGDKELAEHDPQKSILQPKNNLQCGVRILTNQLIDKRKPLLTPSSYWSTLRPGWPGYNTFVKQMANVPSECGRIHKRSDPSRPAREIPGASARPVADSH